MTNNEIQWVKDYTIWAAGNAASMAANTVWENAQSQITDLRVQVASLHAQLNELSMSFKQMREEIAVEIGKERQTALDTCCDVYDRLSKQIEATLSQLGFKQEFDERLLAIAELTKRLECRVKDLEEGIKAMARQTLNESSTESMDSNKATLQKRGRSRRPEAAAGV